MVKDGTVFTPDLSASILPGITRNTIIQIAQDLGHSVVEKPMIRSDLYTADEVFMAGTAVEVTPVNSVDDHEIGVGPVTLELQKAYADTVTGRASGGRSGSSTCRPLSPRSEQRLDHAALVASPSADPLGRQRPCSKSRAETSPP